MKKYRQVLLLILSFLATVAHGDVFHDLINREDPCMAICEETPLFFTNNEYVKSCCQRGCRFFNLVDLHRELEPDSVNGTRDACEASCTEAYVAPQNRYACATGCGFMAKLRVLDLMSLLSIAIYVEEGADSNILLMSPDMPDSDILTDPGLKKELLPGWWDSNGFKLPQTYIKTVPIDSRSMDYGIPSDYSGETEQSVSIPGSDWLQCASRHTGIPRWLLASAIAVAALSALWLCLSPDRSNESTEEIITEKPDITSKVTVYVSDEARLDKEPPPKYSEINDIIDVNVKL